jgi:hypothetical protein
VTGLVPRPQNKLYTSLYIAYQKLQDEVELIIL